jgi:hypothetical protein
MGGRTDACGVFPGVCIRQCRLFEMIPILTVKKGLGEFIEANGAQKYGLFGYCFGISISGLHSASRATTEGRLWWDNSISTLAVFIAMLELTLRTCYFRNTDFRHLKSSHSLTCPDRLQRGPRLHML